MIWHEEGECKGRDQKIWYPDIFDEDGEEWIDDGTIWEAFGDTSHYYDKAREFCEACPVKEACLLAALADKERLGMWGGLTPIERRRIERRERRQRLKDKRAKES